MNIRDTNDLSIIDSPIVVDRRIRREGFFRRNQQREVIVVIKRFLESLIDLVACHIAVYHCAGGKELLRTSPHSVPLYIATNRKVASFP